MAISKDRRANLERLFPGCDFKETADGVEVVPAADSPRREAEQRLRAAAPGLRGKSPEADVLADLIELTL